MDNELTSCSPIVISYSVKWLNLLLFHASKILHEVIKIKKKLVSKHPWQNDTGGRSRFWFWLGTPGENFIWVPLPCLTCQCTAYLFPQVVSISNLQGLELGLEFSLKWDLPVSDLEKFNCYPENSTVSEENCRLRGCLWEVMIGNRLSCCYKVETLFH